MVILITKTLLIMNKHIHHHDYHCLLLMFDVFEDDDDDDDDDNDDVDVEKCRGPDWAQNEDTHFVRACAVETHVKMSQEPLYADIYR